MDLFKCTYLSIYVHTKESYYAKPAGGLQSLEASSGFLIIL